MDSANILKMLGDFASTPEDSGGVKSLINEVLQQCHSQHTSPLNNPGVISTTVNLPHIRVTPIAVQSPVVTVSCESDSDDEEPTKIKPAQLPQQQPAQSTSLQGLMAFVQALQQPAKPTQTPKARRAEKRAQYEESSKFFDEEAQAIPSTDIPQQPSNIHVDVASEVIKTCTKLFATNQPAEWIVLVTSYLTNNAETMGVILRVIMRLFNEWKPIIDKLIVAIDKETMVKLWESITKLINTLSSAPRTEPVVVSAPQPHERACEASSACVYNIQPGPFRATETVWNYSYTPKGSNQPRLFTTDDGVTLEYLKTYIQNDPYQHLNLVHVYKPKFGETLLARREENDSATHRLVDIHASTERGWYCSYDTEPAIVKPHDYKLTFVSRSEDGLLLTYSYIRKECGTVFTFTADTVIVPGYFDKYMTEDVFSASPLMHLYINTSKLRAKRSGAKDGTSDFHVYWSTEHGWTKELVV